MKDIPIFVIMLGFAILTALMGVAAGFLAILILGGI